MKRILLFGVSVLVWAGCEKPKPTDFKGFEVPAHFPQPHYQSAANPITEAGFELGKKLFYDPLLSKTGTIACANCHFQAHGFADHNVSVSTGIFDRKGKRNSPGIVNVAWNTSFMWDGGINHIEVMPLGPLTDTLEMGEKVANILDKLRNSSEYPPMFEAAFGSTEITDQRMLYAMAQFMSMLVSADSKYDRYIKGEEQYTATEVRGLELFRTHCTTCHPEPLFTDFSFRNNGIDSTFSKDIGRERISLNEADRGKFKVPTLRNLSHTYPYMHDGRFQLIEDVVEHYASGIKPSATLDPALGGGIALTEEDKASISAFLYTLTDFTFIHNINFSE